MVQARWGRLKLSLDFRGCRVCTLIEVKQEVEEVDNTSMIDQDVLHQGTSNL